MEFDSKSFLESINKLKTTLKPAVSCSGDMKLQVVIEAVQVGNTALKKFKLFSLYSQRQIEDIRENLDAAIRCFEKLSNTKGTSQAGRTHFDGLSIQEKHDMLKKLKEELEKLAGCSLDAELAALAATLAAENILEAKRKAEEEKRRRQEEEERRRKREKERLGKKK